MMRPITEDPGERFDVAARHPQVVAALLEAIELHRSGLREQAPIFDQRLGRLPQASP